jgi:hypothetical protein
MRGPEPKGNVKPISNSKVLAFYNTEQLARDILCDLKAAYWDQSLLKVIYCSIHFSSHFY